MEKLVTLPLSPTDMVEFFKDKSQLHVIQYDETVEKMNPKSMLTYLANLGISCVFTRITPELMLEFMRMKEFTNIPSLNAVHANILGFVKFNQVIYDRALSDFSVGEIITFAKENIDLVTEQCSFLDSMFLYMETRSGNPPDDVTQTEHFDTNIYDTIGFSLIQLLSFDDFMIIWLMIIPEISTQTYYTRYFDDYMFRGKNLFAYASSSPGFGLLSKIQSEQAGDEEAIREMKAFDKMLGVGDDEIG